MATPRPQPLAQAGKQHKLPKKIIKGNITNKPRSRRSDGCASDDDVQPPDDEGDSSASDAHDSDDDDPDVLALSGAGNVDERLAGYTDDMMFIEDGDMSDDMQALVGAEMDSADEDENYNGLSKTDDDDDSTADLNEASLMKDIENDLRNEFERKFPETMEEALDDQAGQGVDFFNKDPFAGFTPGTSEFQNMLDDAELSIWRMPEEISEREQNVQINGKQKKVRFEEGVHKSRSPSYTSSEASEDPNEHFPDIFMDSADPAIQMLMSHDGGDLDLAAELQDESDAGSVYDFDDDADKFAFELDEEESDSSEEEGSSMSDDEGDETEDESLSEQVRKLQELRKALGHKPTPSRPGTATTATKAITPVKSSAARGSTTPRPATPKTGGKPPRMGTFKLDPTKATLTADSTGKKTVLYLPSRPAEKHKAFWDRARIAVNSRDNSPRSSISIARLGSHDMPPRPLTAQATLGTMFNGQLEYIHQHEVATPAREPTSLTRLSSLQTSFTASTFDADSEMEIEDLDLSQLVHLDEDSDDEAQATLTSPSEPSFLTHGSVGSFRLNQTRARHESSLSSNPAERCATAEMNALQSGRRGAGNTPITPARKKRLSKDLGRTGSGIKKFTAPAVASSPLAGGRRSRGQSLNGIDQTLSPGYSAWLR